MEIKESDENNLIKDCLKEANKRLPFDEQKWILYNINNTKIVEEFGNIRVVEKKFKKANCEDGHHKFDKKTCLTNPKCIWNEGCFIKDGSPAALHKTLPNLVVMAGFSLKSFCNTISIIMDKINDLENVYRSVFVICLENFKKLQGEYCNIRDKSNIISEEEFRSNPELALSKAKSLEYKELRNKKELEVNERLATIIDKIIRKLKLDNVHILGKCAGGLLAINAIFCSDIYTGLFLSVPASPLNVTKLRTLSKDKLKKIKFRFHWNADDMQEFDWLNISHRLESYRDDNSVKKVSRDEKEVYDAEMKYIKDNIFNELDYKSYIFPKRVGHDVHHEFIDAIIRE